MTTPTKHVDLATRVRITFGPVGRGKFVPKPIETTTNEDIAEEDVVTAAWPFLRSEDVSAIFDWPEMTGKILAGIRPVGTFRMEHISPEVWL